MRFALVSPIRADTSSADVASPHISLCFPTVQISPRCTNAAFSSAVVRSKSSFLTSSPLFVSNSSAISDSSKPVRPRSNPLSKHQEDQAHPGHFTEGDIDERLDPVLDLFNAKIRPTSNTRTHSLPRLYMLYRAIEGSGKVNVGAIISRNLVERIREDKSQYCYPSLIRELCLRQDGKPNLSQPNS